jgi:hypothetical protein
MEYTLCSSAKLTCILLNQMYLVKDERTSVCGGEHMTDPITGRVACFATFLCLIACYRPVLVRIKLTVTLRLYQSSAV